MSGNIANNRNLSILVSYFHYWKYNIFMMGVVKMWIHLCLCLRALKMWSGNRICGIGRLAGVALSWFLDISFPIVGFYPFIPTSSKRSRTTMSATIRCDIFMSMSHLNTKASWHYIGTTVKHAHILTISFLWLCELCAIIQLLWF